MKNHKIWREKKETVQENEVMKLTCTQLATCQAVCQVIRCSESNSTYNKKVKDIMIQLICVSSSKDSGQR